MKTGNINKILSSEAAAMPPRSASSSGSSSSGSESGDSSSSSSQLVIASGNGGGSSLKQKKQQRQRGSYASATASSKARGGPTSSAPPAKPASTMKTAIRPLPKLTTDKENEANLSSSGGADVVGTPVKPPAASAAAAPENAMLSPTPYYKVLEERGGKTSPRLTRSAVKRAQTKRAMDSLAQLDNDDDDSDAETPLPHGANYNENVAATASNNDGYDSARIALQFQPPDRHEWQPRQQSKIRKSVQPSTSSRNVKRAKYNNNNSNNNTTNHEQMNADQVRQIMTETLQNFSSLQTNNDDRLLQLSAEAASAQKELEVTKFQLEQLTTKYTALEECFKVKEGGEIELREKLSHSQQEMESCKRQLEVVKHEKQRLETQIEMDGGEWTVERQRMKEEYDDQMQQKEMELQQIKEAELDVVKAAHQEVVSCHEKELEMIRGSANGRRSDFEATVKVEQSDIIIIVFLLPFTLLRVRLGRFTYRLHCILASSSVSGASSRCGGRRTIVFLPKTDTSKAMSMRVSTESSLSATATSNLSDPLKLDAKARIPNLNGS